MAETPMSVPQFRTQQRFAAAQPWWHSIERRNGPPAESVRTPEQSEVHLNCGRHLRRLPDLSETEGDSQYFDEQ